MGDIPECVHHGTDLQRSATAAKLEASNRVRMQPGEYLVYFYCNSAVKLFLRDETETCVLMTNMRLISVEDDRVVCNVPLDEIFQAVHKASFVRCDNMILTRRNGEQLSLKIYRREVAAFFTAAVTRHAKQLLCSTPKSRSSVASPSLKFEKPSTTPAEDDVDCVVDELFRTEERYVNQLQSFNRIVITPLHRSFDKDDVDKAFGNLLPIMKYHEVFWAELQAEISVGHVAKMFLRHAPFFKMYVQYVTQFASSEKAVADLKRKQASVCGFLDQKKQEMGGTSVEDILISPIQRLPRYVLLLEELLKLCSTSSVDYDPLSRACTAMRSVVTHVNECQRTQDVHLNLVLRQRRISGSPRKSLLLQPHRKFLREGPLRLFKKGNPEVFTFYLFSDALVWVSLDDVFQDERALLTLRFPAVPPITDASVAPELVISLELSHDSNFLKCESLTLICASEAENEEWTSALRDAIETACHRKETSEVSRQKRRREDVELPATKRVLSFKESGSYRIVKAAPNPSSKPPAAERVAKAETDAVGPLSVSIESSVPPVAPPLSPAVAAPPARSVAGTVAAPPARTISVASTVAAPPARISVAPAGTVASPSRPISVAGTVAASPSRPISVAPAGTVAAPAARPTAETPIAKRRAEEVTDGADDQQQQLMAQIRGGVRLKPVAGGPASTQQATRIVLKAKRRFPGANPATKNASAGVIPSSLSQAIAVAVQTRREALVGPEGSEESAGEEWD